ncbi:uncharacterized protein LOC129738375 [Uranotaenia lowii]|uniref:uncharacterized protein LOC129738375 n=1 Tax=Uranotaenia lowii TaxID=190385 RepID=UPI00247A20E6|nr:uncharacterized protein LOC129738375 [Uranotaenia lowii]
MLHDHQISHLEQLSTEEPHPVQANPGPSRLLSPPTVNLSVHSDSTVLLETVSLLVVDRYGRKIQARALLDSAAMSNFITKKLANELATRQSPVDIAVAGIGESVKRMKHKLAAKIISRNSDFSTTLDFLVMKKPTSHLPTSPIDTTAWKMPKVPLADPQFHVPATIDIIIGGECYHEFHTGVRHSLGDNSPFLVDTLFGWTVSGKVDSSSTTAPRACFLSTVDQTRETIPGEFRLMETADGSLRTEAEPSTTQIHEKGSVARHSRPNNPKTTLGDSNTKATQRNSTRNAHHKIPGSHAQPGKRHRIDSVDDKPHCYLPHHPVLKEASKTTNERVVFDASCEPNSRYALNDTLLVGSVAQHSQLSNTPSSAAKVNDKGEDAACESCCYFVPLAKQPSVTCLGLCAPVLPTEFRIPKPPRHRWRTIAANRLTAIQKDTDGLSRRRVPEVHITASELSRYLHSSNFPENPAWQSSLLENWPCSATSRPLDRSTRLHQGRDGVIQSAKRDCHLIHRQQSTGQRDNPRQLVQSYKDR